MQNNKLLIISYYWPPSGGSGVQRWLNFSNHLIKKDWDITWAQLYLRAKHIGMQIYK